MSQHLVNSNIGILFIQKSKQYCNIIFIGIKRFRMHQLSSEERLEIPDPNTFYVIKA